MKRLLIIITLFVSSFFLFCKNEVKAAEFIKEIDFSIMEEVIALKERLDLFVETDTTLSDYYLITYEKSVIYYYVLSITGSIDSFTCEGSSYFYVKPNQGLRTGSDLINLNPTSSIGSSKKFYMFYNNSTYSNDMILYSNFDIKYTYSDHSITYTFDDFLYTENFIIGNKISTLYDVYLIYSGIGEKVPAELESVTNFYTMVIEKIEYLAEQIANNYILLSIIGIFIVIFVFLLIFRRFIC